MEGRVLRVPGRPVREIDLQTPRQRRRPPEQLLVEIVAEPTDRLRDHDCRADRVHQPEQIEMPAARQHRENQQTAENRTPDRQAAAPDLHGPDQSALRPVVPVNRWYTRAPTTPPITTGTAIAPISLGSWPRAAHRRSAIFKAASTPSASIRPYACNGSGPMCTMPSRGLGMKPTSAITTGDGTDDHREPSVGQRFVGREPTCTSGRSAACSALSRETSITLEPGGDRGDDEMA